VEKSTATFINGLDLCEAFYREAVKPIADDVLGQVPYSAALIGSGSEVLGFDTEMSADHHWGPRLMLFLEEEAADKFRVPLTKTLSERLPRRFRGYPTSYTAAQNDMGVQLLDYSDEGPINHRVSINTMRSFVLQYLGFDIEKDTAPADWLSFPEQKLRSITAGRVFHDDVGLAGLRSRFAFYPHDVWLYLLASAWARIEQEEHLMGRAGVVDDEIGSTLIAGRLVRDIMHLCFLMEKQYAPYPKWFGTAFRKLAAAAQLEPVLQRILRADNWKLREQHLVEAYGYIAALHNRLGITEAMPTVATEFFDRPFLVISKGVFSKSIADRITDPTIKALASKPLIGNIDLLSDSTDLKYDTIWRKALRGLYVDD
jgi:hypothetical protein